MNVSTVTLYWVSSTSGVSRTYNGNLGCRHKLDEVFELFTITFLRPLCEPVDCGNPPRIKNGRVAGPSYKYKEKLVVSCDRGFHPKSNKRISCIADGTWRADGVRCDPVVCKALSAPNQGSVEHEYDTQVISDRVPWKGQAKFACKQGFQLFGASYASCLDNGTWSTIIPQCQSINC